MNRLATAALGLALSSNASAILIDNGIPLGEPDHWSVNVGGGGSATRVVYGTYAFDGDETITVQTVNRFALFVDPGTDGGGFQLDNDPEGSGPFIDEFGGVRSTGSFIGANDNTIEWEARSEVRPGQPLLLTRYTFRDIDDGPIGPLRVYQYLDADIERGDSDVFRQEFDDGPIGGRGVQVVILDNSLPSGVRLTLDSEDEGTEG